MFGCVDVDCVYEFVDVGWILCKGCKCLFGVFVVVVVEFMSLIWIVFDCMFVG